MSRFEQETILAIFEQTGDEMSISRVAEALAAQSGEPVPSRSTLKRRLSELVEQGKVKRVGMGRGVKYSPAGAHSEVRRPARQTSPQPEMYVPTSEAGKEVRDYVRRPGRERTPTGYQYEFLEDYAPNQTAYLPADLKQHLHTIGKTDRQAQMAGTFAQDVLNRLIIDLSWASSRLEGNTYSRLDTQNLIEAGQINEGKDRTEAIMILNHKRAIELLVENADEIGFDNYTFCNLHGILSDGLLADTNDSGRIRTRIVDISGSVYRPLGMPQQLHQFFDEVLEKTRAIDDPFEQSFFQMVHIPYLQPFIDVNKRVSRLGANISLIKSNLCPLTFLEVPEQSYVEGMLGVYELNNVSLLRDVFVWAYERSCQQYNAITRVVAEPDPFRLRYRAVLYSVIERVVKQELVNAPGAILESVAGQVPREVRDAFITLVETELENLHEGNLSRYRIRLAEYEAWKKGEF